MGGKPHFESDLLKIGLLNLNWLPDAWQGKSIGFSQQVIFSNSRDVFDKIVSVDGISQESMGLTVALVHCTLEKARIGVRANEVEMTKGHTRGYGGIILLCQELEKKEFSENADEGFAFGLLGELCDAAGVSSSAAGKRVDSAPGDLIFSVIRLCMLSPLLRSFSDGQRKAWIQVLYDTMVMARIAKLEERRTPLYQRAPQEIRDILNQLDSFDKDSPSYKNLIDVLCVMWAGVSTCVEKSDLKNIVKPERWIKIQASFVARFNELGLRDFTDRTRSNEHDPMREFAAAKILFETPQ